jgi:hypothetical protein
MAGRSVRGAPHWGLALALVLGACAGQSRPGSESPRPTAASSAVERTFASLRDNPALLHAFLSEMPKGGDLHSHLGGAVYAESLLKWASEGGLCVATPVMTLTQPPCDPAAGRPAASVAALDATLFGDIIDAWSMRNWNPARQNGHDQFFESFGKFGPATAGRTGDMLAEVAARAAAQQVSYLELMEGLDGGMSAAMGRRLGWTDDLAALRSRFLAAGLRDSLARTRRDLDAAEARKAALLRCGTAQADPGCRVTVRYLYQVLRGRTPVEVFAKILTGFELASLDPRVVGFNLVEPEDNPVPMNDFRLHMAMIDFLHGLYPAVKISLHAGELAEGMVPPDGLRFHIRESIERGHALRIGHGVDVLHEDAPLDLLRQMAAQHILVEISLSSNDEILGVRGDRHPLSSYLRFGVPVALSTDDEGVSRSNMTHEYERAALEQHLDYATLRQMARNSLVYAFVEPTEKARLLRELDRALEQFEARWGSSAILPR